MDTFLKAPIQVSLKNLFPDPNNPRLGKESPPGYEDAELLFDTNQREELFNALKIEGEAGHGLKELGQAIAGQGFMTIDNILVWKHPDDPDNYVVVEGNRRRVALEIIRRVTLPNEQKKLKTMEARRDPTMQFELTEQMQKVHKLESIVTDTDVLTVVPVDADSAKQLVDKLPRVLAVRHISSIRNWNGYAKDIWLHARYVKLFQDINGKNAPFRWDQTLINQVAAEASLSPTMLKRQLKSASWWRQFTTEMEPKLPEGEKFEDSHYYLFEKIAAGPLLREKFDVGPDDRRLPNQSEEALFEWYFKHPRGTTADQNPNTFTNIQDVDIWVTMKKYDDKNDTSFAARFDVDDPENAPKLSDVQAEYLGHKSRRNPQDRLDQLLQQFSEITAEQLTEQGDSFKIKLEKIYDKAGEFIKMMEATEG